MDDDLAARYSIWALLRWKRDVREIDTAEGGAEALGLAKRRRPDVCLVSATLGLGDGLTVGFKIKRLIDPTRVLIFADAIDAQLAGAAVVADADGVLWRYADPEQQAAAIRRAAAGKQHIPNLQADELLAVLHRVEERDRPIVAMLLKRIPRDEIARTLGISARALDLRRKRILKRLGGRQTGKRDAQSVRASMHRVPSSIDHAPDC